MWLSGLADINQSISYNAVTVIPTEQYGLILRHTSVSSSAAGTASGQNCSIS